MARGVVTVAAVLAVAGCVPAPPAGSEASSPGRPVAARAELRATTAPVRLAAASLGPTLRRMTVRVRAVGCDHLGTASGVAVAPDLLLTNRHVVADAATVELNHWDGAASRARVEAVAAVDDLALVRVQGRLPAVARIADGDARVGAAVVVVGYPNGGAQTVERGRLLEYAPLAGAPRASAVMRLSARIVPGNSGGPVFDDDGAVVGVVFGVETATGYGLAVPVTALRRLLDEPRDEPPAPAACTAGISFLSDDGDNGIVAQ
jgi:S1-C subfamily serine protease